MQELQDRLAVVTGAASGIGLAMSNRFAQAGMKVVLADIETEPLDAAVNELRAAGHDGIGVVADVAAADAVNDLAAAAFDTHGADHVLCNNAGVVPSSNFGRHKTRWFDRQSGGVDGGLGALTARSCAACSNRPRADTSSTGRRWRAAPSSSRRALIPKPVPA